MKSKIDKLIEISTLLNSGIITQNEFETLKSEILEKDKINKISSSNEHSVNFHNKEKIILKSFYDADGNVYDAPNLTYIDFKDLTNIEIEQLMPFIKEKQLYAPNEMTEDEIKLGNKLFSIKEIAEINSERDGLNYGFISITNLLSAIFAVSFIALSPCMMILGGGSCLIASIFLSFSILSKADATNLDRNFAYFAIVLDFVSIVIFIKA